MVQPYSPQVLDHYENPRNAGTFDSCENGVGTAWVGTPESGKVIQLQIKVQEPTGMIEAARFKTYGCGSTIAASSWATQWLQGKTLEQAGQIHHSVVTAALDLPPLKIHCAMLVEDAIKAAVKNYQTQYLQNPLSSY